MNRIRYKNDWGEFREGILIFKDTLHCFIYSPPQDNYESGCFLLVALNTEEYGNDVWESGDLPYFNLGKSEFEQFKSLIQDLDYQPAPKTKNLTVKEVEEEFAAEGGTLGEMITSMAREIANLRSK